MKLNGEFRLKGGCLCGYVRYELTLQPEGATYCHCDDCRRTTGSAFNVGVRVRGASLAILSGKVKAYTKTADQTIIIHEAKIYIKVFFPQTVTGQLLVGRSGIMTSRS